ncbi:hypothetical protein KIL84_011094 [Mauremys mutica]|uniref:Uncharacterized protein n=1 Tax=Mauremys mutica TaxID=74926 RepID=A0A9D3XD63_9SAUR|nr:hypothetical protein KIL84_011094 [Mauremys mutica]
MHVPLIQQWPLHSAPAQINLKPGMSKLHPWEQKGYGMWLAIIQRFIRLLLWGSHAPIWGSCEMGPLACACNCTVPKSSGTSHTGTQAVYTWRQCFRPHKSSSGASRESAECILWHKTSAHRTQINNTIARIGTFDSTAGAFCLEYLTAIKRSVLQDLLYWFFVSSSFKACISYKESYSSTLMLWMNGPTTKHCFFDFITVMLSQDEV